jgi:hypothetical protein
MSGFWQNWLIGWCWAVGLFGIFLAGGGLEVTSEPIRIIFGFLNGPGEFALDPPMRFSLAVCGAVTIGWSLTLLAAVKAANQLGKKLGKPIWVLVTASAVSWYVIDSTLSIVTGFGLNAVPNTIYMAAFLLPIIRSGVLRD